MRRDMNFFSEFSLKKKTQEDGTTILIKALISVVAALVLISLLYVGGNIAYCTINIKNTEAKLNKPDVQEKLQESNEVKRKKDILQEYDKGLSEIVGAVASRKVVGTTLINQICSTLPTDVEINNINIDHSAINMRGTCKNRESIAELQNNLKSKVDRVGKCQVTSIAGDDTLTFEIKCALKDVE